MELLQTDKYGFKQEGRDLLRGIAGGLILGIPLIYTLEMWGLGIAMSAPQLLGIFLFMLVINVLFSYLAGFREKNITGSLSHAIEDAVTSMTLSLGIATLVLFLIGRIDPYSSFRYSSVGEIILQGTILSLGATFTNLKFSRKKGSANRSLNLNKPHLLFNHEKKQIIIDLNDLAATLAGATVFAFSVAPTEEVVLIAGSLKNWQLILLLIAELSTAHIILFASGIMDQKNYEKQSFFQKPWVETVLATFISMIIASILLVLIGMPESHSNLSSLLASTIVLSFPAVVGGAAGRLII